MIRTTIVVLSLFQFRFRELEAANEDNFPMLRGEFPAEGTQISYSKFFIHDLVNILRLCPTLLDLQNEQESIPVGCVPTTP